jgi:transposase
LAILSEHDSLVASDREGAMRGSDRTSGSLFSYVDLEDRVPAGHPLRVIREIVNDALADLDPEFGRLYEGRGRASIAPERLLRASLLQAFYSIRSERQLMEQIDYNLLFRWFVGLGIDDPVWDHSTFSKNRDRLLEADVAAMFLEAVLRHNKVRRFLSDDHFSVDGTLVEAWASMKSVRAKDGSDEPPGPGRNGEADFHGKTRRNDTHESMTDPDARLYRKGTGQPAKLCFMGHALIENRHGLVVAAAVSKATGAAERNAALAMIEARADRPERITLGADKGYDAQDFVNELRSMAVTPHVARKKRHSAIDNRTARHAGYVTSQRRRKLVEEAFGWAKTIGGLARVKLRGLPRIGYQFTFAMVAYNLIRMPKLLAAT